MLYVIIYIIGSIAAIVLTIDSVKSYLEKINAIHILVAKLTISTVFFSLFFYLSLFILNAILLAVVLTIPMILYTLEILKIYKII